MIKFPRSHDKTNMWCLKKMNHQKQQKKMIVKKTRARCPAAETISLARLVRSTATLPDLLDQDHDSIAERRTANTERTPIAISTSFIDSLISIL